MIENQILIESTYALKGTITIPEGRKETFPAILIISGTGQGDRDGNVKGIEINLYKMLSDFITSLGFITLRYDKRGTHESGGNYFETGVFDLIEDASAAVCYLKDHPRVDSDQIIILGHSEGALLAPAVHQKEAVAGLILLAGFFGPSSEMLTMQNELLREEIRNTKGFKGLFFKLLKVADKIEKQQASLTQKIMESTEPVLKYKGTKINAKWFREQQSYNVGDYLREVTVPVIAITGDKDVQVPPEDVNKVGEMVSGKVEYHIVPNMNHLLRKYETNHTMLGLMKEYKTLVGQPTHPDLEELLRKWLERNFLSE